MSCLASVSELDSRRCILLHLTTNLVCRIERRLGKSSTNETRTERGCGAILCAASEGAPTRRRYVTEPIRYLWTSISARSAITRRMQTTHTETERYFGDARWRHAHVRGPLTGMRFAAVISFRDGILETQRFAGLCCCFSSNKFAHRLRRIGLSHRYAHRFQRVFSSVFNALKTAISAFCFLLFQRFELASCRNVSKSSNLLSIRYGYHGRR